MARTLRIHRLAEKEINRSLRWYLQRSPGAASRLRELIYSGLQTITDTPDSWPVYLASHRAYRLKGFPYVLVYRMSKQAVHMVAFQHTSRRPGYWRQRWKSP